MSGIYTASRTRHAPLWKRYRDAGVPIISSWIDEAGPGDTADWQDLWDRCIGEAANADALIVYTEPEDAYLKGAIAEMGAALSHGVPVFLVTHNPIIVGSAWRHRLVTRCETLMEAIDAAQRLVAAPSQSASER